MDTNSVTEESVETKVSFMRSAIIVLFISIFIFIPMIILAGLKLNVVMKSDRDVVAQVYYDTGQGYSEELSVSKSLSASGDFQSPVFLLPRNFTDLRFDPTQSPGTVLIQSVRLSYSFVRQRSYWTGAILEHDWEAKNDITNLSLSGDGLEIIADGDDSQIVMIHDWEALIKGFKLKAMIIFFAVSVLISAVIYTVIILIVLKNKRSSAT